jgi:4-alpha-glucanotransferase
VGALATRAADLVLVNLEDLWQERRPQNVPGTGPERSNWRYRARHALEAFTTMPSVNETLRWLASARMPRPEPTGGAASPRERPS